MLKKLRLSNKATQEELAKIARVSQARISEWECGKAKARSRASVARLAARLGCNPRELWMDMADGEWERKGVREGSAVQRTSSDRMDKPSFSLAELDGLYNADKPPRGEFYAENPAGSPIAATWLLCRTEPAIPGLQVLVRVKENPPKWHVCPYCEDVMDAMPKFPIIGAQP